MSGKYSKGAQKKIEKVMHEFKEGELKSSSGKKVKSRKQHRKLTKPHLKKGVN